MFKLQKLNVIRIIKTEDHKSKLLKEGFKEVVETAKKSIKKGKDA